MRVVALATVLVLAACSFREEPAAVSTAADPCAVLGAWSTWPEADWVRQVVETGGYNVFSETGSALVASGKGHEFYIWATESNGPLRQPWRRMATVRGIPVYGDRHVWRAWEAQGFSFWVKGPGAPAAGRLAPVIDASLRLPFRDPCA